MKNTLNLFVELGRRLTRFGADPASQQVIDKARMENNWFSEYDIRRAVEAIAMQMLIRERLEPWMAHYPIPVVAPRRILIIMAGNIPLVGFFDLLCTLIVGHEAWVKCSSKDRVLMEYIIEQLRGIAPQVPIVWARERETERPDAVIATGSDNTNRYFRARYARIPALLRGSRQSVAVLSGDESPTQLRGLADDVFAYSGLGCRSVSLLFVPRGWDGVLKPPPQMNEKYRNNYLQTRAVLTMQGIPFRDLGAAVLVKERAFPNALSRIHYSEYDTLQEVEEWLRLHDNELQCVVTESVTHSRRVDFGQAQSPGLTDWPDERDVLEFLTTLR